MVAAVAAILAPGKLSAEEPATPVPTTVVIAPVAGHYLTNAVIARVGNVDITCSIGGNSTWSIKSRGERVGAVA